MEPQCPVLPDDVIEDIFTRLPANLAFRCRILSRDWAAALSSDDFIHRHRRAANRNSSPRFFRFQSSSTIHTAKALAGSPARPDGVVLLPPVTPSLGCVPKIITQHCLGLVLLDVYHHEGSRCVYNPSTGHIALLPPSHWTEGRLLPAQRRYESFGLGYDARSHKHKVVRIYYRGDRAPALIQVYVLDDEGFWRAPAAIGRPQATKPPGWVSEYEPSVFAQGHIHWMAQKHKPMHDWHWRETRRGLIVSFSVAHEAFGVVPLPPRVDYLCDYRLTELDGRLCLFRPIVNRFWNVLLPYDVWELRDHEAGTWELRCRIDPNKTSPEVARFIRSSKASPVAAMDDGRRILFMEVNGQSAACYSSDRQHGAPAL
uniref:F-box domain-containing protein n=1 Tax=Hordeum vulgare subsp. vulgare TaxID=112509 RepID=A0A8I6YXD7_HORVV